MNNKKLEIERDLLAIYRNIGIDVPSNHDEILKYVIDDVEETADKNDWHNGDVAIAFRRFLETKTII
jgi:hypothetical protein